MTKFFIAFLLISTSIAASSQSIINAINQNHDKGFWPEQNIQFAMPNHFAILLHTEQRSGSNYRIFWDYQYELLFLYNMANPISRIKHVRNLQLGIGYNATHVIATNTEGIRKWVWVNRGIVQGNLEAEFCAFRLFQRLRLDRFGFVESHYIDHTNYRYRIWLEPTWNITRYKLTPFVWNEFFFRENTYSIDNPHGLVGGFFENRLRLGINATLIEDLFTGSLCWTWKLNKQHPGITPRWFNIYYWGIIVNLFF